MVRRVLALVGAFSLGRWLSSPRTRCARTLRACRKKVKAIATRGEKPPAKSAPAVRTSFTEREANAYFKVHGA
jgi:hypothetical protein